MKCTWDGCGKETGKPCPPEWIKHRKFDPRVLRIFFLGTKYEAALTTLDAFVCPEHMLVYLAQCSKSNRSMKGAAKRKMEDYSI